MRMRRTGGRITYGIRSRRIKTCCNWLLLHIATQNQVTKSAKRIKLVSLSPRPNRYQTDLLPEAFSHVQWRQPGLHFRWVDLTEGKLHSCTEEHYLCITPHLQAAISFSLLPFLPYVFSLVLPFSPPSILSCHRETRGCHSWQETSLLLHPPRGPATPAASCS